MSCDVWRSRILIIIMLGLSVAAASACTARIAYEEVAPPIADGAVNINTASIDELEALPGVGRKTAEAIVEHREKAGPFRRVEHVMLVRGMSEKRFLEMRGLLTH